MVEPFGSALRLIWPADVLPVGGPIACRFDPEPDTETVVLPPVQVVPSESMVMTP